MDLVKFFSAVALAAVLSGCNGSESSAPSVISGKVADGYLVNAVVFLDKNSNYQLDPGEPSTTTDLNGAYTLKIDPADVGRYPIVALAVQGQTIDKDSGPVHNSYVLSLPSGAVSSAAGNFVSPFSSEVRELMETGKAPTLQQAKDLLSAQLKVAGIDISADYLLSGNAQLHTAAGNITALMMNNASTVFSAGTQALDVNRYRAMTGVIFGNLSSLKQANYGGLDTANMQLSDYLKGIQPGQPFRNMSAAFRQPVPSPLSRVPIGPMPPATGVFVLKTSSEWATYFKSSFIVPPGSVPTVPDVDFNKYYVVVVVDTIGAGPNFDITGVQKTSIGVNVQLTYIYPPSNCAATAHLVIKGEAILVPIFDGALTTTRYGLESPTC